MLALQVLYNAMFFDIAKQVDKRCDSRAADVMRTFLSDNCQLDAWLCAISAAAYRQLRRLVTRPGVVQEHRYAPA
jgi:hypothetical protein